jgi:hypothetical protein
MTSDDIYSILSWARSEELKAHNEICGVCQVASSCNAEVKTACPCATRERTFREVVDKIEKNTKLLHRTLIPEGWDTIDP